MLKDNLDFMEKRVKPNFTIPEETYVDGLIDITQWLWFELKALLKQENRFFGIVNSYMNSVDLAFSKFNDGCTFEDCEIYGQTLYLFKPLLVHEFRRLEKRRISKADSMIILIKRISEYLVTTEKTFVHYKEIKTLDKIITKLYDNIRHSGKTIIMSSFIGTVKDYMKKGVIGKYCIDEFSLVEESAYKEKTLFTGNPTKLEKTQDKIIELVWTGE